MNLQDIAKKEAEARFPYQEETIQNHALTDFLRHAYIKGFNFCLNTLAGSEGDVTKLYDKMETFLFDNFGEQPPFTKNKLFDIIKEHTASAVAKAVGENEKVLKDLLARMESKDKELSEHENANSEKTVSVRAGIALCRNYVSKLITPTKK